jgi:uncharacterized membrane protein YczE
MNKILMGLGLSFIAKMMDGYKTYFGGAVLMLLGLCKILLGVAGVVGQMYPDVGAPAMDMDAVNTTFQTGAGMFGAGLAAIGIGHKVEKAQ